MILRRACGHPSRAGGFTLIELAISGALMTIVLAAAYGCLSAGIAGQRMVEARSEAMQSARVALRMMAADLRSAVPLSGDSEFIGMARSVGGLEAGNLDFATRNYSPRRDHEADFCEVSYYAVSDADTKTLTVYRRRDPTRDPEPLQGGSREEIVRGVRSLKFEFYDGYEWFDEWGDPTGKERLKTVPDSNVSGLPEAVRITLEVDPAYQRQRAEDEESSEAPFTLETTARLNMSLYFYRAGGGSRTNNSDGASVQGSNTGGTP